MGRLAALFGVPLGALLLGACAYKPPALRVTDAKIVDRTEQGFVVLVGVEAENQNEIELPLRQLRYSVTLGSAGAERSSPATWVWFGSAAAVMARV